jgi:hypothetical protein
MGIFKSAALYDREWQSNNGEWHETTEDLRNRKKTCPVNTFSSKNPTVNTLGLFLDIQNKETRG